MGKVDFSSRGRQSHYLMMRAWFTVSARDSGCEPILLVIVCCLYQLEAPVFGHRHASLNLTSSSFHIAAR